MLSNFIIILLALTIPVGAFLSFKAGYKTGVAVRKDVEIPPIIPQAKARAEPVSEEQKRLNAIISNIDIYDGTGEGQVEL